MQRDQYYSEKEIPFLENIHMLTCNAASNSTRFYLVVGDLEISNVFNWLGWILVSYMQFFISRHRRLRFGNDDRCHRP
jgi:hypothetical protein